MTVVSIDGWYPIADLSGPYAAFSAQVNDAGGVDRGEFVIPNGSVEATVANYNQSGTQILIQVKEMDTSGDEALVCGIAMSDADDNKPVAIATRGIVLMKSGGGALAIGTEVCPIGAAATHTVDTAESGGRGVGICLTGCSANNEYVLVYFRLGHVGAAA